MSEQKSSADVEVSGQSTAPPAPLTRQQMRDKSHAAIPKDIKTSKKSIFCAGCQAVTDHILYLDKNNEILALCDKCHFFLKFPLNKQLTPTEREAELKRQIELHHQHNKGQVTVEMAAAERAEYDKAFSELMGIK